MLKNLIIGFAAVFFAAAVSTTAANAACTITYPNFASGSTAVGAQVSKNFDDLKNCVDAVEVDGTWTPTDASGAGLSFSSATAFYHKVGKIVLVWGFVTYPTTSSSLQAFIGSLPFTASNTSVNGYPSITLSTSGATVGFVIKNGTTFGFGTNGVAVSNSTISTNSVYFSGVYPTDS